MSRNIFDKVTDELLEESGGSLFGGAQGYGGTGSMGSNMTSTTAGRTAGGGSPQSRQITGTAVDLNVKDISIENEILGQTGGNNLPFPLQTVYDSLVTAFIELENAKGQLDAAKTYNAAIAGRPDKKELIAKNIKKVRAIQNLIQEVGKDIDQVTVS